MSPFGSVTRRFSRSGSGSVRKQNQNQQQEQSPTQYDNSGNIVGDLSGHGAVHSSPTTATPGTSTREQALGGGYMVLPNGGAANEGRPISSATDASFDFANRPVSGTSTGMGGGGGSTRMSSHNPRQSLGGTLSRTDQVVLKYFWDSKYEENARRDLHYLKFPFFPHTPGHKDLLPYCEVYHLVKTSPGATIISLGSANGVYIGFELQTGSQLHIDLDDDWFTNSSNATNITHHRVSFRPYNSMISDPASASTFRSWPKPLTIEFLEEQYLAWQHDLMSLCWQDGEVRELGAAAGSNPSGPGGAGNGMAGPSTAPTGGVANATSTGGVAGSQASGSARGVGGGSIVDDGYASERSADRGI